MKDISDIIIRIKYRKNPGFCVYNTKSLLRLREAVGPEIGANFDPTNCALNGVLDTGHYSDELHRSWLFRTVGYGHGEEYWRQ